MSFLLPNHYYPWGSFYLEFCSYVFLFSIICLFLLKNKVFKSPSFSLKFFLAIIFFPLVQYFFGIIVFHGDAAVASAYVFAFLAAFIVGFSLCEDHQRLYYFNILSISLLLIGIISVWISLIQWLETYRGIWVHEMPRGGRPFGNLGQPNNYSTLIFISYFSAFYLYERKVLSIASFLVAAIFLLFGLALGQSRTAWVVLACLSFAALVSFFLFRHYPPRRLLFLLSSALGLFVFANLLEPISQYLGLHNELEVRARLQDVRLDMWQSFVLAIAERPFFGFGWGQVATAQLAVAESYPAVGMAQYSHNVFLDLLIWNGIPLGVAISVVILVLFLRAYLGSFSESGLYVFSCLGALLVHSMLEYPHAYAYFLILAGLFFGAGVYRCPQSESAIRKSFEGLYLRVSRLFAREVKINRSVLGVGVVISVAALALVWKEYRLLEEDQRLLRFEAASIGTLRAPEKAPDVFLLDQLRSFLWVARTSSDEELTAEEKQLIHSVAVRYPLPMPLLKRAYVIWEDYGLQEAMASMDPIKYLYGEQAFELAVREFRDGIEDGKPSKQ
jgi:O-antigen ligase